MKSLLCCVCLLLIRNAFAIEAHTTIDPGVTLYSQYYPNPNAKFKDTLIFENGAGTAMEEWTQNKRFLNCAKQAGSLFLYDRSGLGKSPPDLHLSLDNPLTGKFVNQKLMKLLKQNKVNPPYILIAHSYGAMYAGYFTLKYPNLVKGLILVDPVPKSFYFSKKITTRHESGIAIAKKQSAVTIYRKFTGSDAESIYELLGFEKAKQEVARLGTISDDIPVIIISSTEMETYKPTEEDWYSSQKQWLNDNPESKIIKVKAGHFIQQDRPEVVCEQIKDLVNNIKKITPSKIINPYE